MPIASAALARGRDRRRAAGIGGLYRGDRPRARPVARTASGARRVAPPRARPGRRGRPRGRRLRAVSRPISLRMPVPALLDAHDVSVTYGGVRALDGVTLEVRRGEIVGLIGANGAGKSTFFNAVSGLAPTTGSIRYRGVELVGRRPRAAARSGVARTFQDLGLVRARDRRREPAARAELARAAIPRPPGSSASDLRCAPNASCAAAPGSHSSCSAWRTFAAGRSAISPTARCASSRSRRRSRSAPTCSCSTRPPPGSGPRSRTTLPRGSLPRATSSASRSSSSSITCRSSRGSATTCTASSRER